MNNMKIVIKSVVVVSLLIAVVLGVIHSWPISIRVTPGPITISQNGLLGQMLAAAESVSMTAEVKLKPGHFQLRVGDRQFAMRVEKGAVAKMKIGFSPQRNSEKEAFVFDMAGPSNRVAFAPPVQVLPDGVPSFQLEEVVGIAEKPKAVAHIKVDLLQTLGSAMFRRTAGAPDESTTAILTKMVERGVISSFEITLKAGAPLTLSGTNKLVTREGSSLSLSNLAWQANGDVSGTARFDLRFGTGTVIKLSDFVLLPARLDLLAIANYARVSGAERLTVVDPNGGKAYVADARIQLRNSTPILVQSAELTSIVMDWFRHGEQSSFAIRALANAQAKVDNLPVSGGTYDSSRLAIKDLSIDARIDEKCSVFNAAVTSVSSGPWRLATKAQDLAYEFHGDSLQAESLAFAKLSDWRVKIPTSAVGLSRMRIDSGNFSLSARFGRESGVAFKTKEIELLLVPSSAEQILAFGEGTIKGTLPSISINANGRPLNLSGAAIDATFDLAKSYRFSGRVGFTLDAGGIKRDLLNHLGPPARLNFNEVKVDSLDATLSNLRANITFDLLRGNKGLAQLSVDGGDGALSSAGKGCDETRVDMRVTIPRFNADIDLNRGIADFNATIRCRSANEVCIWTKGQQLIPFGAKARAWVKVQPFDVGVLGNFRLEHKGDGRVTLTLRSWQPANSNEGILVKIPVRHLPDPNDIHIRPINRARVSTGIGPWTFSFANPLNRAINQLVGKTFTIKDP